MRVWGGSGENRQVLVITDGVSAASIRLLVRILLCNQSLETLSLMSSKHIRRYGVEEVSKVVSRTGWIQWKDNQYDAGTEFVHVVKTS